MKKKSLLLCILSLLTVTMGVFGIVSCNKDDSSSSGSVVGTWEGRDLTLIFNSDGTGVVIEEYDYYGSYGGNRHTFTYTMTGSNSGRIISSAIDDDETIVTFKITDGNTMILYGTYEDYNYDWVIDVLTRKGGNPSGGGQTTSVVGTWRDQRSSSRTLTLTFNANNTGTLIEYQRDDYSGDDTDVYSFFYHMTDSQNGYFFLDYEGYGYEDRAIFKISGNTMFIYGTDYYGDEMIEWMLTKQ